MLPWKRESGGRRWLMVRLNLLCCSAALLSCVWKLLNEGIGVSERLGQEGHLVPQDTGEVLGKEEQA